MLATMCQHIKDASNSSLKINFLRAREHTFYNSVLAVECAWTLKPLFLLSSINNDTIAHGLMSFLAPSEFKKPEVQPITSGTQCPQKDII